MTVPNSEPDNTPDPDADATSEDALIEQTDNSTTDEDGPQDDISQEPVAESEVIVDD